MIVILHVPDTERIINSLSNTRNLLATGEVSDNDEIYIIFNASAVTAIIQTEIPPILVKDKRVKLVLCKNSLNANHIPDSLIPPIYSTVPSAIQEILRLQVMGALYVRP